MTIPFAFETGVRMLSPVTRWTFYLSFVFFVSFVVPPISPAAPPTFNTEIAPFFHRECVECHRPGEAGPFPLLTYEDVKRKARTIARTETIRSASGPPWRLSSLQRWQLMCSTAGTWSNLGLETDKYERML